MASGLPSSTDLDEQPYLYNGKEFVEAHGLNEYDSQGQFQNMDYLQYYNSFERGMITNPVIQGVAVGGLGVMAVEGVPLAYYIFQNSSLLQFVVGLIEGYEKGHLGIGPDAPFIYESQAYQVGSNLGSWVYEKIHK